MASDNLQPTSLTPKLLRGAHEIITQDVPDFCGEAWSSFKYSAVTSPLKGIAQLAEHTLGTKILPAMQLDAAPKPSATWSGWLGQQAGSMAGMTLDFMVLGKAIGVGREIFGGATAVSRLTQPLSIAHKAQEAGKLGFLFDGICKPVEDNEGNFWWSRFRNATTGGFTFATISGSTAGVQSWLGKSAQHNLMAESPYAIESLSRKVLTGGLAGLASGIPGGLVNANIHSLLTNADFASWQDIGKSMLDFSITGGLLGAGHGLMEYVTLHGRSPEAIDKLHDRIVDHGRREMSRWGYKDIANSIVNKRTLAFEDPELSAFATAMGSDYGAYYKPLFDVTRFRLDYALDGIESNTRLKLFTSHELRHRANTYQRTMLKMADPEAYKNLLIDEVVRDVGRSGKRVGALNNLHERTKFSIEEAQLLQDTLRQYLQAGKGAGQLGRPVMFNYELSNWLSRNNVKGTFTEPMLNELRAETVHANAVMDMWTLPQKLLLRPENVALCTKLHSTAEKLKIQAGGSLQGHPQLKKALQNISSDTVGAAGAPEYYECSVEEIRARRQEHSSYLRILADEIKNTLLAGPPEIQKLLRPRHNSASTLDSAQSIDTHTFHPREVKAQVMNMPLAEARLISDNLHKIKELTKGISYLNSLEKFQADYGTYMDIRARDHHNGTIEMTAAAGQALEKLNSSLLILIKNIPTQGTGSMEGLSDYRVAGKVVSRLLQYGITAEQLLKLAPAEKLGAIGVGLHNVNPTAYPVQRILELVPQAHIRETLTGLLNSSKVGHSELLTYVPEQSIPDAIKAILNNERTCPPLKSVLLSLDNSRPAKSALHQAMSEGIISAAEMETALLEISQLVHTEGYPRESVHTDILQMLDTPPGP